VGDIEIISHDDTMPLLNMRSILTRARCLSSSSSASSREAVARRD